jgi:hypothetical protein
MLFIEQRLLDEHYFALHPGLNSEQEGYEEHYERTRILIPLSTISKYKN